LGGYAALYFRCRFAFTGFDGFLLTEKEKVRLGESLAMMMRILLRIDPRYVAIIVFSVTFSTTVVTKEMAYRAMIQQLQSGKIRDPGCREGSLLTTRRRVSPSERSSS